MSNAQEDAVEPKDQAEPAEAAHHFVGSTVEATASTRAARALSDSTRADEPTPVARAAETAAELTGRVADRVGDSEVGRTLGAASQAARTTASTIQGASAVAAPLARSANPAGADAARSVGSRLAALGASAPGGRRIEQAHFELGLTEGPDTAWVVRRLSCRSELSEIYEIELDLVCDDVTAPVDEMLGAPCELLIERGDLLHTMYGIIDQVDDVGPDQDRLHAKVRVVPAFGLLADQVDTRIFQGQTAIKILTDVLGEALAVYGREVDASSSIKREYHTRDYCTQFRESTLDFCCRLMEEEGIAFYFAPDDEGRREKLVLIDNNNDYPRVELSTGDEVPIIEHDPEEADSESIRGLLWRQRRRINKVSGRAYNFKAADTFDEHEHSVDEVHNHHPQELYLHDHRRQITDDPVADPNATSFDGTGLPQRQRLVEQTLQEHRAQTKTGHGHGNVTGFHPGRRFRLVEHHRGDVDGSSFLLLRVIHTGEHDEQAAAGGTVYTNEFTVIPMEHEFRPRRRTRRAKVYGPQLAVVVGLEGGDEIHTDQFGRIKIQFHHDRRQPSNDTASCWVRVLQPWAGPRWGSFFIPRVGMEVVVQFVDGDPDQPVVVGTVYNSVNMPPHPMPDEKTKSTIKTSSVGAEGYNELTFEDAAGHEQIIVHAQKDLNEKVENNHATLVGANQTNAVDGNQSESVGGNQSMSVSGNRNKTVTKNEDVKVDGNRTSTIKGDETLTIQGHTKQTYVTGLEQKVTSNYKLEIADLYDVKVSGRQKVQIIGTSELKVTDTHSGVATNAYSVAQAEAASMVLKGSKASLWGQAEVAVAAGKGGESSIVGNSAGKLGLSATTELRLACGAASIVLSSDGKIAITGSAKVELSGGSGTIKLDAAGAAISGPGIKAAADGIHEITGAMVKIN